MNTRTALQRIAKECKLQIEHSKAKLEDSAYYFDGSQTRKHGKGYQSEQLGAIMACQDILNLIHTMKKELRKETIKNSPKRNAWPL